MMPAATSTPSESHLVRRLYDRIDELQGLLADTAMLPSDLRLTPAMRTIMAALMTCSGVVRRERLYLLSYGDRPDCDQPETKIIDVQVCKIRQRVRAYCEARGEAPVEISTQRGIGFFIRAEEKARLRAMTGESE